MIKALRSTKLNHKLLIGN